MEAKILLADAVTVNGDGTFSLLRGGIDRIWAQSGKPMTFIGGVAVRFLAGPTELGIHDYRISCVNDDGKKLLEIAGKVKITEAGGAVTGGQFQITFPSFGTYSFIVTVDNHEVDHYQFKVRPQEEKNNPRPF